MTRPDLDAIRARWKKHGEEHTDIPALLAYVEELEADAATLRHRDVLLKRVHGALADMCCRVPMGIDEPVDAIVRASLARANQRFVDEYDARVSAEERAVTAEERLERVTHERDQERKVFEQAMAEAQTDANDMCDVLKRVAASVGVEPTALAEDASIAMHRGALESCNRARAAAEAECIALRRELARLMDDH